MKVRFHPEFPKDVRRFVGGYREVSPALEERFRIEVNEAIATVKVSPTGAGHYLQTGSAIITDVRRRNLRSFPRRRGNCTASCLASGVRRKPREISRRLSCSSLAL